MPVTRLLALNPQSGAFVPLTASIPARAVAVREDGSVTAQGLEVRFPADQFTTTATLAAGTALTITGAGHDGLCGLPEQNAGNGANAFNYRGADVYCQLRSATATATTVQVTESEALS